MVCIHDQDGKYYGEGSEVKFETRTIKSSLCDYSDPYIFVTGDITATGGGANTSVVFKNCAPFTKCIIHINDQHIDTAESLDITM